MKISVVDKFFFYHYRIKSINGREDQNLTLSNHKTKMWCAQSTLSDSPLTVNALISLFIKLVKTTTFNHQKKKKYKPNESCFII